MILTVDPGLRRAGAALWYQDGVLKKAWLSQAPSWLTPVESVRHMARDLAFAEGEDVTCAVSEFPRLYGGRAAKGSGDDLFLVAAVVGGLAALRDGPTVPVLPTEWGASGKGITEARCREDLSPEELARVQLPSAKSLRHNVFDAVAIGLWWLRREGIRRR